MDVLSLIGIIMAFVAIIGGNYLEGGHLGALANGPAALIVIGGTVGAALLQSPMSSFKRAMQILIWIIFPPRVDLPGGIDRELEAAAIDAVGHFHASATRTGGEPHHVTAGHLRGQCRHVGGGEITGDRRSAKGLQ